MIKKTGVLSLLALLLCIMPCKAEGDATPTVAQWQFTASWYFGLLPGYEVIQPVKLLDASGNDITAQCLNKVKFASSDSTSISVSRVPAYHPSGMAGHWMLKAGDKSGNASITGSYSGTVQWNQTASTTFTVFCGDPNDNYWNQNNIFGIDPMIVYAGVGSTFNLPTITVNGYRNALTDFDITAVRSANAENVEVIAPVYNSAGVLVHGYQFNVKNTTPTRIWVEVTGKGQFVGYWAKIYFHVNGLTTGSSEPGGGQDTPSTPSTNQANTTCAVKIPVQNYVLASGQTIHQTPSVSKTVKASNGHTETTDVTNSYTFTYTCDRPDYAYVAADGTVTALQETKEPVYINVKATPKTGASTDLKEASTSYSIQIYSSESVIRLNPTELTIPMASATEGEKRLVPSIIMKVNGTVYEPNQENTYDLSYEGFDKTIVALVDSGNKVQGTDADFSMANAKYFKALKAGTTNGVVHARGKGINSGFWGTAPFSITVTPYTPTTPPVTETSFREIFVSVPSYTIDCGNTIRQRIKVKEYANAEAKQNNQYTDVTSQYTLSYASSNTQIATVDGTGLVTAVAENVNPAFITITATPVDGAVAVSPASFEVKVFGGASVISPASKSVTVAPGKMIPVPNINVVVDGIQYSTVDAFNLYYEVTSGTDKAEIIENSNIRGKAEGDAVVTVKVIGKGAFEGFYGTTKIKVIVSQSVTLNGENTWWWSQEGARSPIYNLYPGKQLHFEFTNKTIATDTGTGNAGWTFIASKTPDYSDQAFLAANPFQNYITWDGWGEHANPQPEVTLNNGTFNAETFKTDLKNAKVDYIVSLGADGKTLSITATIEAKDAQRNTVRTYEYTIANKQLSYEVGVLPVYFSAVRSTIETLRLIPNTYTAKVAVNGTGGSVKIAVNGTEQSGTTVSGIAEGSRVTITAIPNTTPDRYYFEKWTEDDNTSISRDFYIDHNITLTANFAKPENKWLNVTQDGQEYLLNKANYDNDYYFKVKRGSDVYAEKSWINNAYLQQTLTTLYGDNDRHIDLYVRGAKAFKVYAYDANGTESTYTVKVDNDNGEAQTVAHHGTSLEASQIFYVSNTVATNATGDGFNTITLKGNDNQLYPYKVVFYTKSPIQQTVNRQYVTLADGVADAAIAANQLASAGTLSSVTYSNNKDKEVATVEVVNGQLQITGKKAGNIMVKLNFTGGTTHSDATFDYTVVVKKRDVRMRWSKKAENIRKEGNVASLSARLSFYEIGLDGDTINKANTDTPPYGVEINYVSTKSEIFTWDLGVKFGSALGSADLIARIDETDQIMASSAAISINITGQLSGPSYDVGGDTSLINNPEAGKKDNIGSEAVASFDLHVYKYNSNLSDEAKDKWGDVKEYQGSEGMKKVWYLDGFSFNTQGNQNAMNEKFRTNETSPNTKIWFETTTGDDAYKKVHPFSLPVRGSFVKFDAKKNGVLTAYVLQNGNFNFNHISEYEAKKSDPFASKPRLYYWFDQEGNNLQSRITATTKQPLAVGRRDDLPELTAVLTAQTQDPEINTIYAGFVSQAEVDRNLEKDAPDAQPIIKFHGGYTIMNKAYVKYDVPVKAGNTYYFFSNDSKVAFAGVTFTEEATPAQQAKGAISRATAVGATLTLAENDDWSSSDMLQYKGKTFQSVTLARSFTQNQWNTICLPFNVSEKQVEDVFGEGTQLVIYNGMDGSDVAMFMRHVDQNILAGQPYFIYPTKANITSLTFTNVTIPADLQVRSYGKDDANGLRMVGALSPTNVAQYDYYVNTTNGNIYRYTGSGTQLKTYRAFLQQTHPSQSKALSFGFTDIEAEALGTPTGLVEVIDDLGVGKKVADGVYNLNGQKVSVSDTITNHGVYIVNGKKIIR